MRVVIVGGGWAGCAAAVAAKKAGAGEVILVERCDMLLGTGLVGGIMQNNGRFTAQEEMTAMGGSDLFRLAGIVSRHHNIDFPGHKHASLYDVTKIEPTVRYFLESLGIQVQDKTRVVDIKREGQASVKSVITENGREITGDVFIETTGTAGPPGNCTRFGNGCVMCIYRCPTFGPRISLATKMGVKEKVGRKDDGTAGAMSGSCKIHKESLSKKILKELEEKGVVVVPIPNHLAKGEEMLKAKACRQYALEEYSKNLVLLDTGHAKLMAPFFQLELLRQIPGFENACFVDPYSGGVGNSIRFLVMSPADLNMKTKGVENLFCAGEKAGPYVGHTEAIVTGMLAGQNSVRLLDGRELLQLPNSLACGNIISQVTAAMEEEKDPKRKYTFSGAEYFQHMKEQGLYSVDVDEIERRVELCQLTDVFS
ncbi:MAG: FAD-dependent oxidoreductase [Desulfitobacteriaceae bacterium]|nr:FAD-dependent oxidoreductase [Desulfitobacteriaceae bacterium]